MADRELTPEEISASVRKTLAEADAAVAAARKSESEVETEALEREHKKAQIEQTKIEVEVSRIALAKCEREERFARVSDIYHRCYTFDQQVSEASVRKCINTLTAWARDEPGCDMRIVINSPGGDIIEGFALIDFITDLRKNGHKVTTVALGMAASMAGVLLQSGDVRVMGKNAIMLIHEGSLGAVGSFGEVEDRVKLMKLLHERILDLFESRAKTINPKTTKTFLRKMWTRADVWLTSEESLRLGLIDEIQ